MNDRKLQSMKKILTIFLFAIIFFTDISSIYAVNDNLMSRTLEGQRLIFARQYDESLKFFDGIIHDYPSSPAGFFGKMAVLEMRMLEREDFFLEKEFEQTAKDGLLRVSNVVRKKNPDVWDLFLAGSLLGLDGFYNARKDNWWDAYVLGSKSRQIFRRVKEIDPSMADADFGLGMYIYWRSVFAKDIWFLKMFPDRREEGINIVKRVAEDGVFSRDLARVNLAIMFFEEKRYEGSQQILNEYITRFPENVIIRNLLGRTEIALKHYDGAVAQFREILKIDSSLLKPRYFIGTALVLSGDSARFSEAEFELRLFLQKQGGKYWPSYAHYWLGRLNDLRGDKQKANMEYAEAEKLNPKIKEVVKKARSLGAGV